MSCQTLVVSSSSATFAATAAREMARVVEARLRTGGRATVALAGGATPIPAYRKLALTFAERLDWSRVEVFFGDERVVSESDHRSNFKQVIPALEPISSSASVHRVRVDLGARQAAREYERRLIRSFGSTAPAFDLVVLGIGGDGHTASLFASDRTVSGWTDALVRVTASPVAPRERVSFTYRLLHSAKRVVFLARGCEKAQVVARVLSGREDLPAARVAHGCNEVVWVLDPDAASGVETAGKLDRSVRWKESWRR